MEQVINDIIKVFVAQTHSAVKVSEIICEHSDRDIMTGHDIICGLVYRLMVPMTGQEITEAMENAEQIMNDSDDEAEDYGILEGAEVTEDTETDHSQDMVGESRNIKSNQCNCDICAKMRVCLLNYQTYEPTDDMAMKFKNAIEDTCQKHNIHI